MAVIIFVIAATFHLTRVNGWILIVAIAAAILNVGITINVLVAVSITICTTHLAVRVTDRGLAVTIVVDRITAVLWTTGIDKVVVVVTIAASWHRV